MPEDTKPTGGLDELIRDLEDDIFGVNPPRPKPTGSAEGGAQKEEGQPTPHTKRRITFPTLVDQKTARDILDEFMRKEKNQRKYEVLGVELLFKPYWFFTYSAELVTRDSNKNIVDAAELSGRVAIDAINASLADYLQDLLDHEPIELVDLSDEMAQVGGDAKILEPKINEDRVEKIVQQKIAGVLKCEKENIAVAGFELVWSPVYRFWLTIKKRTHNVQIDGCGGYPVNYDDIPAREKTWLDVVMDDMSMLKNPKKWKELLQNKQRAAAKMISSRSGARSGVRFSAVSLVAGLVFTLLAIYGLSNMRYNFQFFVVGVAGLVVLFWYANQRRKQPAPPYPSGSTGLEPPLEPPVQ